MKTVVLGTPGFVKLHLDFGEVATALDALSKDKEPSWFVSDPSLGAAEITDGGRTVRAPGSAKWWAIRDDHLPLCGCGCGADGEGASVITLLTPDDY